MPTVVELTSDEAKLLAGIQRVIQKEVDHERQLARTAAAGNATGDQLEAAMERVRKSNDDALKGLLGDLKKAGPEGRSLGEELRKRFAQTGQAGQKSIETIIAELRKVDPAAAAAAEEIQASLGALDEKIEFKKSLEQLRRLGPEGEAIAKGIAADMAAADAAAGGDMTQILDRLKSIDPTVEASADKIRTELGEAARFSEGKFADTLTELRRMGPVGKQVAEELKTNLVQSGQLAEKSIEDVIGALHKIDPAAAKAAKAIHTNIDEQTKKSTGSFETFAKASITQIVSVAGAYVGIQEGIQLVTKYLNEQQEVLKSSLEKQIQLAKAQQEASKNLAGLSVVQRDELLQQAVPKIANETGFADVAQITNAIGAAVSRGADSAQAAEAVKQSARVEINTPDNLDETAGGAVALQIQTGLKDIREAIALIQTTGTQSAIVDPAKLIEALPKAVGASVSTVREQDVNEAARESAALFAQITQGGNDEKGTSSATFQIDLTARLDKFFSGFSDELINARSKIELIDRKIAKGSDTEANRRDREQLIQFVQTGEQVEKDLANTSAFKTLSGRIETIQRFEPLEKQFVGSGFGEKQFQTVLKDLFDADSDRAKGFTQSSQIIQASPEFFEQQAAAIASGTPQLALANFQNRSAAGQSAQLVSDNEGGALAAIREAVKTTLAETRTGGITGFISAQVDETGIGSGILPGSTAAEEAVAAINTLKGRRDAFAVDGITTAEQPKVDRLDQQIEALKQLIEVNAKTLAPNSINSASERASQLADDFRRQGGAEQSKFFADLANDFRRVADAVERQNTIAERGTTAAETTASNTQPRPNQNASDIMRQSRSAP